jgi:translocation and assembly module TamB
MTLRLFTWLLMVMFFTTLILAPLYSPTILRWVAHNIGDWSQGRLTVERADGQLARRFTLEGVRINLPAKLQLKLDYLRLDWRPFRLLDRELCLRSFEARGLQIELPAPQVTAEREPVPFNGIVLPIHGMVGELILTDIVVLQGGKELLALPSLHARRWQLAAEGMEIGGLALKVAGGEFHLNGFLPLQPSAVPRLELDLRLGGLPLAQPLIGRATVGGTLAEPQIILRTTSPSVVMVEGRVAWQADPLEFDAVVNLEPADLQRWHSAAPAGMLGGRLTLRGNPARMAIGSELKGDIAPTATTHLKEIRMASRLDLDLARQQLAVDMVQTHLLEGRVDLLGQLAWENGLSWQGRLSAQGINPVALAAEWPARLESEILMRGRWHDGQLRSEVDLLFLRGEMRQRPFLLTAHGQMEDKRLQLSRLHLESGSARLQMRGRFDGRVDAAVALMASDLQDLYPGLFGQIELLALVNGAVDAPEIVTQLRGEQLAWQTLHLDEIALDLAVDLSGRRAFDANLRAGKLRQAEQNLIDFANLRLDGRRGSHQGELELKGFDLHLFQSFHGQLTEGLKWRGELLHGSLELPALGHWLQHESAALDLSAEKQQLANWCWREDGDRLCLHASQQLGSVDGLINQINFDLQRLKEYLPQGVTVGGVVRGEARVAWPPSGDWGQLDLAILQAQSRIEIAEREPIDIAFRQFGLQMRGNSQGVRVSSRIDAPEWASITSQIDLPGWQPTLPWQQAQVSAEADVTLAELSWLARWVPALVNPRGAAAVKLDATGTLAKPRLSARLSLTDAGARIPQAGIDVAVEMEGRVVPDGRANLSGRARSGSGALQMHAASELKGWLPGAVEVTIDGERFETVRLPFARVDISPRLRLTYAEDRLSIGGEVVIPRASLGIPELPPGVTRSNDVVVLGREIEQQRRLRSDLDLVVALGDSVRLEGQGFKGRLGGRVRLRQGGDEVLLASGELLVLDGSYKAYGQDLIVERGRLLYANTPVDDPSIDLVATRTIGDVKAGVRVSGRLNRPELTIFSIPAMDSGDALAYLILGRPLNTASKGEGDALYSAALGLGLAQGEALAKQIGDRFGIDKVEMAGGTTEDASLVLGKSLSPRLYLEYAVGLFDSVNVLRLRYTLSEHWTLQTEQSSRAQGGDIFYVLETGRVEVAK